MFQDQGVAGAILSHTPNTPPRQTLGDMTPSDKLAEVLQ